MLDRVKTLCDKLKDQLDKNEPVEKLVLTVQMMQGELAKQSGGQLQDKSTESVFIEISSPPLITREATATPEPAKPEEKIIEVLQVDEAEVEAELEEIKRNAESRNKINTQNKPALLFDPVEDIPTLTHQQTTIAPAPSKKAEKAPEPSEEHASLNDKLRQTRMELSESLKDTAIKDLKKAIGVNDRFVLIQELFRGDEVMYERSIKTINGFSIYAEAEYWIKRELKLKLGWNDTNPVVKQFDQLVRRRFS